jgi:hypothetical protein
MTPRQICDLLSQATDSGSFCPGEDTRLEITLNRPDADRRQEGLVGYPPPSAMGEAFLFSTPAWYLLSSTTKAMLWGKVTPPGR